MKLILYLLLSLTILSCGENNFKSQAAADTVKTEPVTSAVYPNAPDALIKESNALVISHLDPRKVSSEKTESKIYRSGKEAGTLSIRTEIDKTSGMVNGIHVIMNTDTNLNKTFYFRNDSLILAMVSAEMWEGNNLKHLYTERFYYSGNKIYQDIDDIIHTEPGTLLKEAHSYLESFYSKHLNRK